MSTFKEEKKIWRAKKETNCWSRLELTVHSIVTSAPCVEEKQWLCIPHTLSFVFRWVCALSEAAEAPHQRLCMPQQFNKTSRLTEKYTACVWAVNFQKGNWRQEEPPAGSSFTRSGGNRSTRPEVGLFIRTTCTVYDCDSYCEETLQYFLLFLLPSHIFQSAGLFSLFWFNGKDMLLLVWASQCSRTTSVTHVAVVMYLFIFEWVFQKSDKKVGRLKKGAVATVELLKKMWCRNSAWYCIIHFKAIISVSCVVLTNRMYCADWGTRDATSSFHCDWWNTSTSVFFMNTSLCHEAQTPVFMLQLLFSALLTFYIQSVVGTFPC